MSRQPGQMQIQSDLSPAQAETQPPPAINLVRDQVRRKAILNELTSEYQIAA